MRWRSGLLSVVDYLSSGKFCAVAVVAIVVKASSNCSDGDTSALTKVNHLICTCPLSSWGFGSHGSPQIVNV